jgi:1-acyl-sn-glycerol-3-phosphate acyltransferase
MHGWYRFGYNLSKFILRTFFRMRVIYPERLLEEGGVIYAANHASYLDPPIIGTCCQRPIYYLARKTLMKWPILGPIFPSLNVVPVDQERADMSALKTIIKLVREGHRTIIFPEGARTLDGNLGPAQPGLGLVVSKTRAPVVPMRIFGSYEAFPRGSSRVKLARITVVVGEPIIFTDAELANGRESYQRVSERVLAAIGSLQLPS